MQFRNIIIGICLTGMVLPFLLVRDIYPFYRLGMYATSYRKKGHIDKYIVIGEKSKIKEALTLKPTPSLIAEYVFRKETKIFLQKFDASNTKHYDSYSLYKISFYAENPSKPDTILLDNWKR